MARDAVYPPHARLAAQLAERLGVSIEVMERMLDEEDKRQLKADAAERRRRPGRRPEWRRDFWIMHEVEWHRGQKMNRKSALKEVSKAHKLSFDTVRKVYEREKLPAKRLAPNAVDRDWRKLFRRQWGVLQTDRDLRELYRRHPGALVECMKDAMEKLQEEMDEARSRFEDLRQQEEDLTNPK